MQMKWYFVRTYPILSCIHRNLLIRCFCIFFLPKLLASWFFYLISNFILKTETKKLLFFFLCKRNLYFNKKSFKMKLRARTVVCMCLSITIWMTIELTPSRIYTKKLRCELWIVVWVFLNRIYYNTHLSLSQGGIISMYSIAANHWFSLYCSSL